MIGLEHGLGVDGHVLTKLADHLVKFVVIRHIMVSAVVAHEILPLQL